MNEEKKAIEELAESLNTKMESFENEIKSIKDIQEKNEGNMPEELGQKLGKIEEAHRETSQEYKHLFSKQEELNGKMQEQLDAMDIKLQRKETEKKKASELLADALEEKRDELLRASKMSGVSVQLDTKADMTLSSFTNEVIDRDRLAGVYYDAERAEHIRDYMTITPVSTDVLRYVSEGSYTDNMDTRAENSAFAQSEFALQSNDETMRKIGTYLTLSREMLADATFLNSYLQTRVMSKLLKDEDDQILNGSGVAPNLNGLTNAAQAYVDNIADSNVQRIDVLAAAATGAIVDNYVPNVALVHPNDYQKIILTKDGNQQYMTDTVLSGRPVVINGARLVKNTAVTEGEFLVGDLRTACTLAVRSGIEFRFTDSHASEFIADMVTVVAEERVGLPVYQSKAIVYGTFTAALGDGTA